MKRPLNTLIQQSFNQMFMYCNCVDHGSWLLIMGLFIWIILLVSFINRHVLEQLRFSACPSAEYILTSCSLSRKSRYSCLSGGQLAISCRLCVYSGVTLSRSREVLCAAFVWASSSRLAWSARALESFSRSCSIWRVKPTEVLFWAVLRFKMAIKRQNLPPEGLWKFSTYYQNSPKKHSETHCFRQRFGLEKH